MAFLQNRKDAIVAMDFFMVPTASLRVLYFLFVIEHQRRRVVHFNVTLKPTSGAIREGHGHQVDPNGLSLFVAESRSNAGSAAGDANSSSMLLSSASPI